MSRTRPAQSIITAIVHWRPQQHCTMTKFGALAFRNNEIAQSKRYKSQIHGRMAQKDKIGRDERGRAWITRSWLREEIVIVAGTDNPTNLITQFRIAIKYRQWIAILHVSIVYRIHSSKLWPFHKMPFVRKHSRSQYGHFRWDFYWNFFFFFIIIQWIHSSIRFRRQTHENRMFSDDIFSWQTIHIRF